jgi:hypothetical protein
MIVVSIQSDICTAVDPMNVNRVAKLDPKAWRPLATVISEKPRARSELAQKALVLALWNRTGMKGDWTTEFFWATVVRRPSERAEEEVRGYELDFGDFGRAERRNLIVVPEQFVVAVPHGWKRWQVDQT